jgi:FkbM family methyltransferase
MLLRLDTFFSYLGIRFPFFKKIIPLSHEYSSNEMRTVQRDGVNYRLDISDYMQWTLFADLPDFSWQYAMSSRKSGDIILDVGANVGHFCLKIAQSLLEQKLNDLQIHAFEPNPAVFSSLISNFHSNDQLKNVVYLHNLALGNKKETEIGFAFNETNSGGGRIDDESGISKTKVKMVKLDDWVRDNNIRKIDFMKIDVEGYEPDVLLGGLETIQRFKPVLYLEITDDWFKKRGYSAEWVFDLLSKWGYQWWIDVEGKLVSSISYALKFREIRQFNILAKPTINI